MVWSKIVTWFLYFIILALLFRALGGIVRIVMYLVPPRQKCATRIKRGRLPPEEEAWEVAAKADARGPLPSLHVAVLVTGTRGDVDPFCATAIEIARQGHRVRLAAHACYRGVVADRAREAGVALEFYPLAGDPKRLSQWMVEAGGRLLPRLTREDLKKGTEKMRMIQDILHSCWPACTARDPDEEDWVEEPFRAQAIIANPVAYGHIHCAEALRCPLLVAFPQPWTPTKEFPHVFSGLPFTEAETQANPRSNYASYAIIDELQWQGLDAPTWRRDTLGLSPLYSSAGSSLINDLRVPFAGMWSPSLLPRTKDAGDHVCVVGSQPPPKDDGGPIDDKLKEFLPEGAPPIFVGFGSMVVGDPAKLWDLIVTAAEEADVRVVAQSSWSTLEGSKTSPLVLSIGPMPHSRLFPKCGAAVHHGGAGTVHATLACGLPTLVVPFFGDQPLWGEVCRREGVGPAPIPFAELTAEKLAAAFKLLAGDATMKARAQEIAAALAREDGVTGLVDAWTRSLPPSRHLVCWASLFCKSEPRLQSAQKWHSTLRMRLSLEANVAVSAADSPFATPWVYPYAPVFWDTRSGAYFAHRLVSAAPTLIMTFFHDMIEAVTSPFMSGAQANRERDLRGRGEAIAVGFITTVLGLLEIPLVIVLSIFWLLVTSLFQVLDFLTCGLFDTRILFDAPDNGNNIALTGKTLRSRSRGQALGATAAARSAEERLRVQLRGDAARQEDLLDAAALADRVRQALVTTCPPDLKRDAYRLDVLTPAHARAILVSLLKADWEILHWTACVIAGGGDDLEAGQAPGERLEGKDSLRSRARKGMARGSLRSRFVGKPSSSQGSSTVGSALRNLFASSRAEAFARCVLFMSSPRHRRVCSMASARWRAGDATSARLTGQHTQVEGTHQVQPHRRRHPQQLGRRAGRVGAPPAVRDEDRERAVPPRPRRRRATEIRQLHKSRERVLRPEVLREEGVEPPHPLTNTEHTFMPRPPRPRPPPATRSRTPSPRSIPVSAARRRRT